MTAVSTNVVRADADTIDMGRAIFVAMAGSRKVPFIDPETNRIAGSLDVGLVPHQVELAASISKILAIDGLTARLSLVDLVTGEIIVIPLAIVPERITVSSDGLTAALADKDTGAIVLLDLLRHRQGGTTTGPQPLRDMVFSADSRTLYVSGGTDPSIGVVDANTAQLFTPIATGLAGASQALTRSPNGRQIFVRPVGGGAVGVLDLERRKPLSPIQAGPEATVAFPSATGAYLLIADNRAGTLTVLRGGDAPTVLQATTGVNIIYTAWFDTLALVPSTTTNTLLLFDLDAKRSAGRIELASAPERGAVTPDGQTLYLPLPAAKQVAVIDTRRRRIVASIPVEGTPTRVLLAGSYGVCH